MLHGTVVYQNHRVVTARAWLFLVERIAPDRWDLIGGAEH